MPRSASMTVLEAELAVAELNAGSTRPVYFGNSRNQEWKGQVRAVVRKWLAAKGIPSAVAGVLTYTEMEIAYNDNTVDKILKKIEQGKEDLGGEEDETATQTTQATQAAPVVINGSVPSVQHVAELLTQLLAKGALDKDAVNALIDSRFEKLPELVAQYAQVTRVEVKRQDGTEHKVKGHAHPVLPKLIKAMSSRQANGKHPNIMICGPTGGGKTHGVEQASESLGLEFYSNGAISMDYQLIGFKDANGNYHETPLRKAFSRPATYLFDEIDSSQNSPLLCLAGALANNGFPFPDAFVERHPDCVIIAAGNTWGNGATADFVGRNKLDGAIRSRFPVRLAWDYDEALERNISGNVDWACRVQKARQAARTAGLKVIIDPRMTQAGAALIAAGFSDDDAAAMTYLADLTADQRKIVEA